jgi:hypothetical protein
MQAKLVERAQANVAASSRQLLDAGILQLKVANATEGAPRCNDACGCTLQQNCQEWLRDLFEG